MGRRRKERTVTRARALWALLAAAIGLEQAGAAVHAATVEQPAIERVDDIREALLAQDAEYLSDDDHQHVAQWYNWPNWNNWSDWRNWRNW